MNEATCRRTVKARSDGRCERCGRAGGLTLHHRLKRSQGGRWAAVNVLALCGHGTAGCHGWAEEYPNAAEADGYHVRPWQNPADIPVSHGRHGWCLLLDDGGVIEIDPPEGGDVLRPRASREDAEMQSENET